MTLTPCARCAAPDGAHQPWCLLQAVIDRFLLPPAPPLTADQIADIAARAARDAAQTVLHELLGPERHLTPVPEVQAAPEPTPEPEPEPQPAPEVASTEPAADVLAAQLSETVRRHGGDHPKVSKLTLEREAAAELFVAEGLVKHDPNHHVSVPDLQAAYEAWRPLVGAPALPSNYLGAALRKAGYKKRQAYAGEAGGRYGSMKPMLWFGVAIKPLPEPAAEPPPAWMSSDSETKRADSANGYIGQWPGREIPNDFRNKIVVPILRAGKGWVYKKANSNGAGKPRLISPEGQVFTLPNTPSDWRALKNTTASLRKLGAAL